MARARAQATDADVEAAWQKSEASRIQWLHALASHGGGSAEEVRAYFDWCRDYRDYWMSA